MLAVAMVACLVALFSLLAPLTAVVVTRQRVAGAADAAALAAAEVAVGILPGVPCDAAATVASANRTTVLDCHVDGATVTVRCSAPALGFAVLAQSTAGPATETSR